MSSYGYQSDHVNLIANNLQDRYKSGFPILKELIQNADDAKAQRLVFGLHPGFKGETSHPLLQGQGLWVFNDGQFKKEDEFAIRSFGLNSKAGESDAIGKFGLGMKSVYHLCEAFFYVAFDGKNYFDVFLNPWHDPNGEDLFHSAWNHVEAQEFEALRSLVIAQKLNKNCESWFLMWIPLRKRDHVPQKNGKPYGGIIDKYPGDAGSNEIDDLFDGRLSRKIRSVVPLLRNLELVELASFGSNPGFKVQVSFDEGSQRVDHRSAELVSIGNVSDGGVSRGKLRFRIQQKAMPGDLPFSQFQGLDVWPKTGHLNSDGIREPVPDKSQAEGAVLVSGAPADGEKAKLDIHWAVFLPIEDGLNYECSLEKSSQQYKIVLHGQFFVDAGRRGIAGLGHLANNCLQPSADLDVADLHTGWNQAVAQKVILPQFLPTLAQFADGLKDDEKEELARAILNAKTKPSATGFSKGFWDSFRDFVCTDQAWLRLITPDGLKWSHVRITKDSRLLFLPRPPNRYVELPWKVLPGLQNLINEGCFLVDEAAPSLMRTHNNWDQQTLIDVLASVDLSEACSDAGMEYLTNFLSLENKRYVGGSDVQRKLVSLLRTMLRQESLQTFRNIRSIFQALVSLVKPEYRIAIGTKDASAQTGLDEETLKLLIGAETEKLVLPRDLDSTGEDVSTGVPDDNEVRSLLKVIDHEVSKLIGSDSENSLKRIDSLLRAAQSVLGLLDDKKDERGKAVRVNRSLRVLTANCARSEKGMPVSLEELLTANNKGLLFKPQGIGTDNYFVAKKLANLLPNEQIWVVSADIAGWVYQRSDANSSVVPSATEPAAAYKTLGKRGKPFALADKNIRHQFLKNVFPPSIKGEELIRGVRYVLHGSDLNHDDTESILWISTGQTDAAWVRLKAMVEPDAWNVIDPGLAGQIKQDDWEPLGISKVGPDEVMAYMAKGFDADRIDAQEFSGSEITSVLGRISDEKLWKAIPLHRDQDGKFGPIADNCFLDSEGIAPLSVLDGVRIIAKNDDLKVQRQQDEYIPLWSHQTTIERILATSGQKIDWKVLLDVAGKVESDSLSGIKNLRSARWLPLSSGGTISPDDVLDFDKLAADIDRLASNCGYCYAGVFAIASEVQAHPNFLKLRPLFSSGKSGLEKLGLLMVEAGDQSVGVGSFVPVNKFVEVIDFLASLSSLPGWGVVKAAIDAVGVERIADVTDCLIKEIRQPLSVEKLVAVLNEISQRSEKGQADVFNLYLKQLVPNSPEILQEALSQIQLQAIDGQWKAAKLLCAGVEGVDKSSVLNRGQAQILKDYIASLTASHRLNAGAAGPSIGGDEPVSSPSSAKALAAMTDYFKTWREHMPSGPIGAFFALLGPSFRESAVQWLKPHSYEHFVDQITWNEPGDRNNPAWDYKRREHPKLEALDMLDFLPQISSDKQVKVLSLLGEEISVAVGTEFDGLVVGNLVWSGTRGGRSSFQMRLRTVYQPEQYDKSKLSEVLRNTCECILREAYNQKVPNIGQIWETLAKSDQFELAVARGLILDRLPYELRNLRTVKKNQVLVDWQNSFKKLESSRAEKKEAKQATDQIEKEIVDAKTVLSHLMTTDKTVQAAVLSGIKERVCHNTYEVSSIAFEILQNADDAVIELQALMHGDSAVAHPSAHVGRFVMETDGSTVRFLHWGRPVNYMGHGKSQIESHGEDLQRMLTLAASDKDETPGLTGKFGLGFKSVLLATDAPCLLSGDLKTMILGGCLPEYWSDASGAVDSLHRHKLSEAPGLRGTVVEFKVNDAGAQSEILDRFAALAGLQSIFCKEIRSIKINGELHQWSPKVLAESLASIETGEVQMPAKDGHSRSMLMNFRVGRNCFLLKIGSRGFVRFADDSTHAMPAIWVTAPTREPAAHGLILNGQFELDTGRGGLPHGDSAWRNLAVAEQLGLDAADLVLQATSCSKSDWEGVRSNLKLAKDVCASDFWASFWVQIPLKKLDTDATESSRLLSAFGHGLFKKYIFIAGELPNGLPGALSTFVNVSNICLALNSRWEKHFEILMGWAALLDRFPLTGWVSDTVAVQLKASRMESEINIAEVSIEFILDLVPNKRCSAELMSKLCLLFEDMTPSEGIAVKAAMMKFSFQAKDGSWNAGQNLLKEAGQFDNQCLPFAPGSSVLNPSYQGAGLKLLQDQVPYESRDPRVIAEWILASPAKPQNARVAGLRFLLGNHSVQMQVSQKIFGSWLEGLPSSSPYLAGFSIQEKNQLLGMFNPQPTWADDDIEEFSLHPVDPGEALIAIRDWWTSNSVVQLEKFDKGFWPQNVPKKFDSASEDRGSWMTLLALGLMQRHGRVPDHQNRGFIDMMLNRGFWEVFCSQDPHENGKMWLDVLEDYSVEQVEDEKYGLWMDNFPRLYRIARHLDVYIHLFQGLDCRDLSQVSGYLSPGADPEMSGSGIYAPTLGTSLKLGQHVVIRELLRAGALHGETAKSLAYKPGSSVKAFLTGIGLGDLSDPDVTSQKIYRVLTEYLGEDATFDNAFDIPLLILARDDALQQAVLGAPVTNQEGADDE